MSVSLPGYTTPAPGSYGQGTASAGSGSASSTVLPLTPQVSAPGGISFDLDAPQTMPAPYAMDIDAEFQDARYIVDFGADRAAKADEYIASLQSLAQNLSPTVINPAFPALPSQPALNVPAAPYTQTITFSPPDPPAAFTGQLTVDTAFPTFSAGPPQLTFPNAPQAPHLVLPDSPTVDLNFTYPTVDVELPAAPPLLSIDVQPFKGVDFPTLTATAPVLTAVPPSLVGFAPNAPYTDALLQTLKSNLQARLSTGLTGKNTGLPPVIETAIWNRGREREYRQQADAIRALGRMETMGYAFPPGAFIDSQIKIQTDTAATLAGNSRDVAIEQAKLEQQNLKDALEQSTAIESKLIDYANQTEQRRFEALRYMTEAGIAIYNAQVQAFGAVVTAYRAAIDVYTAQINGARAQVDIYTAEIAAEKLKVDANTALIEQYKVRVDAALASIQVFEGEIQLVKTQAEVEQIKVSVFGEQVRAYAAEAQVFSTQVEAYKAGIEAQTAIQQTYATQAQVYSTLVGATSKEIDAQVEVFKAKIEAKNLEVETYKAEVQAQAEKVRAIAAQDQSVAAIYSAQVSGQSSLNSALVEEYKTQQTIAEQIVQIGVAAAEANGKLYLSAASIATDAAKVGAQVEAQLGASALGAVTFATHKSRADSVGFSQSIGFSQSKSMGLTSSTSTGLSTTVNFSNTSSVSATATGSTGYSQNTNIAEAQ